MPKREIEYGFKNIICFYINLSQIKLYCVQLVYIAKQHICIYCTYFGFSKLSSNLPRGACQLFFVSFPNLNLSRVRKWDIQCAGPLGSRLIRSFQLLRSVSTIFQEHSWAPVLVSELFQPSFYLYTHCPFQNKQPAGMIQTSVQHTVKMQLPSWTGELHQGAVRVQQKG